MFYIPIQILNQIAKEEKLKSNWAKKTFTMSQQELKKNQEDERNKLEKQGYSNKVILTYQASRPLLVENRALESFMSKNEKPDLAPTFQTPEEAMNVINAKVRLKPADQQSLLSLLQKDYKKITRKKKELSIDELKKRIEDLRTETEKKKYLLENEKKKLKLVLDELENIEDQLGADILDAPDNIMNNYSQKKSEKEVIKNEIDKIESELFGTFNPNDPTGLIYKHDSYYEKLLSKIIVDDDVREHIRDKRIKEYLNKLERLLKEKLIENKYDVEKINDEGNILDLKQDIIYKLADNDEITRDLASEEKIHEAIYSVLSERELIKKGTDKDEIKNLQTINRSLAAAVEQKANMLPEENLKLKIHSELDPILKKLFFYEKIQLKRKGYYQEIGTAISPIYQKYKKHFGNKRIFIKEYHNHIMAALKLKREELKITSFERYI